MNIKSDDNNIVLSEKKVKKVGEEYFDTIGYYGKLENAFNAFLNLKVKRSSATTIKQLLADIESARTYISKLFDGV